METIKGNEITISVNGTPIGTCKEIDLIVPVSHFAKYLITESLSPLIIKAVDKQEVTPENLIGKIMDNKITFVERVNISFADYKFMLWNADELKGFSIDDNTTYTI